MSGLRDIEDRIGVGHIDHHIARWIKLSNEAAPLRALHGTNGKGWVVWEAQRKANIAVIKMRVRAEATASGNRLIVDEIDAIAHADPEYISFITRAVTERTRLAKIEEEMQAIQFVVYREQAIINAYGNEPR